MNPSTLQIPSYATVSRGPSQDVSVHASGDDKGEPVKLESWSHIRHLGDRRRVQNMNAQRKYRHKRKKMIQELEQLAGARSTSESQKSAKNTHKSDKESSPCSLELQNTDLGSDTWSQTPPSTVPFADPEHSGSAQFINPEPPSDCISLNHQDGQIQYVNCQDIFWEPGAVHTSDFTSQFCIPPEIIDVQPRGCYVDPMDQWPWNAAYDSLNNLCISPETLGTGRQQGEQYALPQ